MCQKFTNFKIAIKNLVGGRLAWALSHGAGEEKTLLEKNLLKLYLSGKSGWVFFEPCCYYQRTLSSYAC